MKTNKYYKALFFSFGWFRGEDFKLFSLTIWDNWDDGITFFNLQIAKLCFSIGVDR